MAACQVPMDAIDPCAAFSSIGTIVASVVDLGLRVTLSNMFTNCSYIPFLVRWDLVPPYPFGSDDLDEKNNGNKPGCEKEEVEEMKPMILSDNFNVDEATKKQAEKEAEDVVNSLRKEVDRDYNLNKDRVPYYRIEPAVSKVLDHPQPIMLDRLHVGKFKTDFYETARFKEDCGSGTRYEMIDSFDSALLPLTVKVVSIKGN